jgi:hypothetical protein
MKVAIAGTRSIEDYMEAVKAIEQSNFNITEVISGAAVGVDKLGEKYARVNNLRIMEIPANWGIDGPNAGKVRNAKIANSAEAGIIVWDGVSIGTLNLIAEFNRQNKPCFIRVVNYDA